MTARLEEYRKDCVAAAQRAQDDFDKAVLSLSGGALAVSFAFIKDLVGPGAMVWPYLLLGAWVSWGTSIVATFASFWFSQRALRTTIEQVDTKTIDSEVPGGKYAKTTEVLNAVAGVLFVVGVTLIVLFVGANIGGIHSDVRNPADFSENQTEVSKVITVGPFSDADTVLSESTWGSVEESVAAALARQQPRGGIQSILLLGGVDRRDLSAVAARRFASNQALARARAEAVRSRLLRQISDTITVFVIPQGASELTASAREVEWSRDRRVDIYFLSRVARARLANR